ncbi:hypothetical protein [Desertivirga arenae]|uniref:hypothetical protein n=1 Tax=Desertivirga arenae TaxID=2810309 RepID=UPI001A960C8F|nr:hypothetical protein [Pedobacter sp. SYSU D00823]
MLILLSLTKVAKGQYEGIIYADVILKDRSIVSGAVRWSGGQLLWTDILLVSKKEQYALKYLTRNQINALSDQDEGIDWEFMNLWKDKLPERRTELLCRFGDIASIHVTGAMDAQIFLKNGSKLRVVTDSRENRHLGKDITVFSPQSRKVAWNSISRVIFKSSPDNFNPFNADLLYGTISTSQGELSGFIQWDKIKFLTSQRLEGKLNDVERTDTEYPFNMIASIEKRDKGAIIKFDSEKKVFLKNNRDVNASNHGIVVMHPAWGRAIVDWEAFNSVRFSKMPKDLGYASYRSPKRIYAVVKTNEGEVVKGNCIFDLDEQWNVELLEGRSNSISYQIPFNYISNIKVISDQESRVTLKDEKVLTLHNHNDVTSNNWGIVVLLVNSKHRYIPWSKVREISFK